MSDLLTPLKIAGAYYINDMVKKRDVEDVNGVWMFGCFDVDAKELVKSINGYAELKHENEALRDLMQENKELKRQLETSQNNADDQREMKRKAREICDKQFSINKQINAQLAGQLVYTNELEQLIRAGFMQGGKYRDLFKSERKDVFNTLNPSPELLAEHDDKVITDFVEWYREKDGIAASRVKAASTDYKDNLRKGMS